jgi:hypothetical protein
LFCQHVKTPPPKKKPNFFSPASDCHKDVYIAICSPKKAPNFFSPAAGCHKDVYMAICPPKNRQFFFACGGCYKDMYMAICPPKKPPIFFACGGLSQRRVYGHLRTCKAGTIYQISASFNKSPAWKNFRPFLGRHLSQKKQMSTDTLAI